MFVLKLQAGQLDAKLSAMLKRVKDLTPAMQDAIDITNESVLDEFSGSYYLSPSGAKKPWKTHVPFGRAKRGRLLWNRGRLKAAMTGGAGSASKASSRTFAYGFEPNMRFSSSGKKPVTLGMIVAVHRGGLRPIPNEGQITKVRANEIAKGKKYGAGDPRKFQMYWKLRRSFGVRASHKTLVDGFKIPARPFAAASKPLKQRISKAVKDYIVKAKRKRG